MERRPLTVPDCSRVEDAQAEYAWRLSLFDADDGVFEDSFLAKAVHGNSGE